MNVIRRAAQSQNFNSKILGGAENVRVKMFPDIVRNGINAALGAEHAVDKVAGVRMRYSAVPDGTRIPVPPTQRLRAGLTNDAAPRLGLFRPTSF